jgi:sulfur carrier protein
MQVFINQIPREWPEGTMLAQALQAMAFSPPFAVAINLQFVPKTQYAHTALNAGDQIEVISPITGG